MITFSGIEITPENLSCPTDKDITIQMGRQCRYGGALPWTTLAHSVLVGEIVVMRQPNLHTWAAGMLHDAHEIATGDALYPFKEDRTRLIQRCLDQIIHKKYGLDPNQIDLEAIKWADEAALVAEVIVAERQEYLGTYRRDFRSKDEPVKDFHITMAKSLFMSPWNRPMMLWPGYEDNVPQRFVSEGFQSVLKKIKHGGLEDARTTLRHRLPAGFYDGRECPSGN